MRYTVEIFFQPNPVSGKTEGIAFPVNLDMEPSAFEAFLYDSVVRGAVPLTRQEEFMIIPKEGMKYLKVKYKMPVENALNAEEMEFIVDGESKPEAPLSMEDLEYGN
jgi:hypothetical protein